LNRDDAVLRTALNAAFWALPSANARDALEALLQARDNHGWLGVASFVGFAWVGTGFVSGLARGMNRVYQVPNRHYVFQRTRAFIVVVAFAILFQVATVAAILPTFVMGREFVSYFQPWILKSENGRILSYGVAVMAAMCLFLMLFWALPNAGQRFKDVWPGTLTAGVMFLGIVQIFPLYIRFFNQLNRTATIFGFVSILVFWFYLLAHVLLFGTYINATWQCHRRRGRTLPTCPSLRPESAPGADGMNPNS
jgi:membrane protein